MRSLTSLVAAVVLAAGAMPAAPAFAQGQNGQPRSDQESARQEMRAGNVMSLRQIERIVVPKIEQRERGFRHFTSEWDEVARAYRLKFSRDGQVIWVDVDARTARIIRISR